MVNFARHSYGTAQVVDAYSKRLQKDRWQQGQDLQKQQQANVASDRKATQDYRMKTLLNNANTAADNKMFKLLDIMYKGVESGNDALADMAESQLNELAKKRKSGMNYSKIHDKAEAIQAQKNETTKSIQAQIAGAQTPEALKLAFNRMIGSKKAFSKDEFDLMKYGYDKQEKELQAVAKQQKTAQLLKEKQNYNAKLLKEKQAYEAQKVPLDKLRKSEQRILNPKLKKNPAIKADVNYFNKESNDPYVYIWSKDGSKQVELPILEGKQITAKEAITTFRMPKFRQKFPAFEDFINYLNARAKIAK